jgi:hypothetical protein
MPDSKRLLAYRMVVLDLAKRDMAAYFSGARFGMAPHGVVLVPFYPSEEMENTSRTGLPIMGE